MMHQSFLYPDVKLMAEMDPRALPESIHIRVDTDTVSVVQQWTCLRRFSNITHTHTQAIKQKYFSGRRNITQLPPVTN